MTISEQAAAIKGYSVEIDAAIEAKGGTTPGGLVNAAAAIEALPSGGGEQFDVSAQDLLGVTDSAGLLNNNGRFSVSFDGLKSFDPTDSLMRLKFYYNAYIDDVVFPDLEETPSQITNYRNFNSCFAYSSLKSISFPSLKTLRGSGSSGASIDISFYQMCGQCKELTVVDFPELLIAENNVFSYGFEYSNVSNVSFPKLIALGGSSFNGAFRYCTALTSVSFPALESVFTNDGSFAVLPSTFQACTKLVSASFPKLRSITNMTFSSTFSGCSNLSSVTFDSLEEAVCRSTGSTFQNAFLNCTKLVELRFPALKRIVTPTNSAYAFLRGASVKRMYFPELEEIDGLYLGYSVTALTELHFAAKYQAQLMASQGYATKWGISSATIYFDL